MSDLTNQDLKFECLFNKNNVNFKGTRETLSEIFNNSNYLDFIFSEIATNEICILTEEGSNDDMVTDTMRKASFGEDKKYLVFWSFENKHINITIIDTTEG